MRFQRLLQGSLLLVLITFAAPSAFAFTQDTGDVMDNICGSIDDCFHSGDWWLVRHDNYGSVTTCGLWGCQTCVDNGHGKLVCAYHTPIQDACRCTNKRTGSPGITTCTLSGICAVTNNP